MATATINGVRLNYQLAGAGTPLVLVHGSWSSLESWAAVVPALARRHRVLAYDRRGHSGSERPAGQGSVREDVADLAALIEHLGLAPAWVVGNSFGATITLRLAAARPDLLRGALGHEPPLFALLAGDPATEPLLPELGGRVGAVAQRIASGDHAGAAEAFAETVALGPGSWAQMPPAFREAMIANAPTFLDETLDPEQLTIDLAPLAGLDLPLLLTAGAHSPPLFAPVIARLAAALPRAEIHRFPDAGHIPQVTHPEAYVATVLDFIARHDAG